MVDYWGRVAGSIVSSSDLKNYINKYGDKVYGVIIMQSNEIVNLPNPLNAFDAATKCYVDTTSYLYLPLTGGTVDGDIILNADVLTVSKLGCDNLGVNTEKFTIVYVVVGFE